ncbi:hypothetical protein MMPV_005482 [Pyropia vietnamensis]
MVAVPPPTGGPAAAAAAPVPSLGGAAAATATAATAAAARATAGAIPAVPSPLPREDRVHITARLATHFDALRPTVHRPPAGILTAPWTTPGGYYNQLWDWDGFFIGVHLAHQGEPEHLVHLVTNFVTAFRAVGFPPAVLTPDGVRGAGGIATPAVGGDLPASATTSPVDETWRTKPFMAQALAAALDGGARLDAPTTADLYDGVVAMTAATTARSRHHPTGLSTWVNAMASGADNNVALVCGDAHSVAAGGGQPPGGGPILAVDASAWSVAEARALARVAARLGRPATEVAAWTADADAVAAAMRRWLWCAEDGTYYNRRAAAVIPGDCGGTVAAGDDDGWVRRITYSNYTPLYVRVATAAQASAMVVRYISSPVHLLSPAGLRSLSRDDAAYTNVPIIAPASNWRGPVWPIANWLLAVGLVRYGHSELAAAVADRLASTLLADLDAHGGMHENYSGEDGSPLAPTPDVSPVGEAGGFVGWNLLTLDLLRITDAALDEGVEGGEENAHRRGEATWHERFYAAFPPLPLPPDQEMTA